MTNFLWMIQKKNK